VVVAVLAATGSALGVTAVVGSAPASGTPSGRASVHLLAQGSPAPSMQRPASSRWTGVTGLSA